MKRNTKILLSISISIVVIIACIALYYLTNKKPPIYGNPVQHIDLEKDKNLYKLPNGEIKPLEEKDFSITDGNESITLDTPYKYFKTSYEESKQEDNFYTDVTVEDITYKYFIHKYKHFNLFVSNANYQAKKRPADDQYIAMLVVNKPTFKTLRGINVGTQAREIEGVYGNNGKYSNSGTTSSYTYRLKDMELFFKINEESLVQEITMRVIVGPTPKGS